MNKNKESKKVIGNNFPLVDDDPQVIDSVIERYKIPPHKRTNLDGTRTRPKIMIKGKILHKKQRLALVHFYMNTQVTVNAARISRLIHDDYNIGVKPETISKDIKTIQDVDPVIYEVLESNLLIGCFDRKKKAKEINEIVDKDIKELSTFHKTYQAFKKLTRGDF